MSTPKGNNIEVDIIHPSVTTRPVTTRPVTKRGPKHRDLPGDLIKELANEGMGSKAIATRLRGEGVKVSYRTIQRLLSGKRRDILVL